MQARRGRVIYSLRMTRDQLVRVGVSHIASRANTLLKQPSFVVEAAGVEESMRTVQAQSKPPMLPGLYSSVPVVIENDLAGKEPGRCI